MYLRHLSSLQFLTYAAFLGVVIAAIFRFVPGKPAPARTTQSSASTSRQAARSWRSARSTWS